jgi:hypothetical protein
MGQPPKKKSSEIDQFHGVVTAGRWLGISPESGRLPRVDSQERTSRFLTIDVQYFVVT